MPIFSEERNIKMNKKSKILPVFTYMRYSSDMQNYMSIKAQRRAIREYCKGKYQIVREYVDEAKSATTDNRPQFQQMMKDVAKSKIYAVVVHKLDRFSRNKIDSYVYKALLQKQGVKLLSVMEHLDDTPESEMLESMIFSMNEFYSKNLGREVQKGKKEAAYKGLFVGGIPPYGYDVDENKRYILNKKESKAVRVIFDMYINDYSYQQIADYLNSKGYRTKKGTKFNKNSFSSILENAEKYTGVYMYNRASVKCIDGTRNSHRYKEEKDIIKLNDKIPRIISDDVYNKVKERMAMKKENAGKFHSKRYYLLNSLIVCGDCGRAYTGNTSKAGRNKTEYSTYRCGGYRGDCNNKAVNIDYLNDFVLTMLTDIVFDCINYDSIIGRLNSKLWEESKNITRQKIIIKNKLVQVESALIKLTDYLIDCNDSSAVIKRINSLEEEKKMLIRRLEKLENYTPTQFTENDLDNVKKKFKIYLLKYDSVMCRKFIRSFVDSITIYDDKIEVILKTSKEHKKEYRKIA